MKAEIISIGTELLLGHIINTNTAFLCRKLAEIGIDVYHTSVVGDNPQRLVQAINEAGKRSDIIILTGGLGPTVDDITVAAINALVPKNTRWLKNRVGTAPGLIADYRDKIIICLPGPPGELEPMFVKDIVPYLKKRLGRSPVLKTRTIKITGLPESLVNNKVKDLLRLKPPTTVGIYAKLRHVELKIMAKAESEKAAERTIAKVEKKICGRLKGYIFGCDDETLESAVAAILFKKRLTIATAESCTGGLLSNRLTNISGSSKYFIMGLVAYSNEAKENILCVDPAIISSYGAVSAPVARQMAIGIKLLAGADIGIGITGIAGPTGAAKSKPVGLVYIAIAFGNDLETRELKFRGSREEIKFQASQIALDLIRKQLG